MNGRGLFDRYMDDNTLRLLSEDIEEVYDFPRKKDDTSVDEKVKVELTSNVDTVTNMVLKMNNAPDEYDDEEGYSELDSVNLLLRGKGYRLYTDSRSAFEQLNPRIIVKRIADSDMVARKNMEDPKNAENEEGIFTRIFDPKNINKIRQDKRTGYEVSDIDDEDEFAKFLRSRGYGTKKYSAIFKNEHPSSSDERKQSYVAVPDPVNINTNGKIEGSGNFSYYKLTDDKKLGDKVSGPVGRFNTTYISTGEEFTDKNTNTTYHIFRKEMPADYLYGYFRDRDAGEKTLSQKDIDALVSNDGNWQQRLRNAELKHSAMRGARKANPQYYPFDYKDYFYVRNINGTYVCIRVVTSQSKEGFRKEGQLTYKVKSTDVIYVEGYVLETPPPDVYENPNDPTDFVNKVSLYIDDTIKYIRSNIKINNKALDPRTPNYKAFVADPNKNWMKMDSFINATTIMVNTLDAFHKIYRHMTMNLEEQSWMTPEELPLYQRAEITFKKPDKNNPFGMPENHYKRIIQYLRDFQKKFYGADWRKIDGIEPYVKRTNAFFIVRQWCIRQLEILKILFKYDIENSRDGKYIDDFRNLGEFESKYWRLQLSDVQINATTSQDQDVMESIRRRLLEYC